MLTTGFALAIIGAITWFFTNFPTLKPGTVGFFFLLAILTFALRWGRGAAVVASLVASALFDYYFTTPVGSFKPADWESWVNAAAFLTTALMVTHIAAKVAQQRADAIRRQEELERRGEELQREKLTSESLLLNILPNDIAQELRKNGKVSPKYFEDVTIIFTDFVGFTRSTEKLSAEEVVDALHEYFTTFDHIAERYHLEKLKTMGDSYMCACGLPVRDPGHPVDGVMAALEMLRAVEDRDRPDSKVNWQVRIGIHTGPVVAGVVGIHKFAFDVWGETVNYAARMEATGLPNRVNVSATTYSRIKDFIACEYRGKVITKEAKELDTYLANKILPVLMDESGVGPPAAFTKRYVTYFSHEPYAFPSFALETIRIE